MNERKFQAYMDAAKAIEGDYSVGYRRGLRRYHHGEQFGTGAEHQQWMTLGLGGDHRTERGDGYRDGAAGKPPRGTHAGVGNDNAARDEPADTWLQVRLNARQKARYVKQAQQEGLKLSAWVLRHLDAVCYNTTDMD